MPYLNRNGVQLYYETHGEGPPLLLSHGYGATSKMWRPQIDALSQNWKLILWDMRGHGRSDSPVEAELYSEALTVADMAALLQTCGEEQAVIGGLSLGGYMSLAFHNIHPMKTRALLLFDTGPGYRSDEARAGWNRYANRQAEKFREKGLAALASSDEVDQSEHRSAEGLALAARGMLAQQNAEVINSLPNIQVPTLVLVGSRDEPYFAATDYMQRKIPGALKQVVDDAGHASNIHQPDTFNRVVLDFLADLKAQE